MGHYPSRENHRGRPKECSLASSCSHSSCQRTLTLSLLQSGTRHAKGEGKDVVIKNGELISGVIDKASIGAEEPDSVLHRIAKDYGTEAARRFLDSILTMLKTYITHRGFSYGYSDLWLSRESRQAISDIIQRTYEKVYELIKQYNEGTLPLTRGLSGEEALELYVVNELSQRP